ncbi:unnamed protein product, partial [Amoebophrya sp. A25]
QVPLQETSPGLARTFELDPQLWAMQREADEFRRSNQQKRSFRENLKSSLSKELDDEEKASMLSGHVSPSLDSTLETARLRQWAKLEGAGAVADRVSFMLSEKVGFVNETNEICRGTPAVNARSQLMRLDWATAPLLRRLSSSSDLTWQLVEAYSGFQVRPKDQHADAVPVPRPSAEAAEVIDNEEITGAAADDPIYRDQAEQEHKEWTSGEVANAIVLLPATGAFSEATDDRSGTREATPPLGYQPVLSVSSSIVESLEPEPLPVWAMRFEVDVFAWARNYASTLAPPHRSRFLLSTGPLGSPVTASTIPLYQEQSGEHLRPTGPPDELVMTLANADVREMIKAHEGVFSEAFLSPSADASHVYLSLKISFFADTRPRDVTRTPGAFQMVERAVNVFLEEAKILTRTVSDSLRKQGRLKRSA